MQALRGTREMKLFGKGNEVVEAPGINHRNYLSLGPELHIGHIR
jgi:hypothetical protein